ncbi:MAG: hypothetical protein HC808_19370, partial [Candidatus Competibacteraceae bacterium]|nr:hypothetical protein [Candidatus Competibacteraceae bacterium]
IDQLRKWASAGIELAGHGWRHVISNWGGIRHRLHGLVLSRNVAEHLALSPPEIMALLEANFRWFMDHDLPAPRIYCAPGLGDGQHQSQVTSQRAVSILRDIKRDL